MARKLKVQKATKLAKREPPKCREHDVPMRYFPAEMAWQCMEPGCDYRRMPKNEVERNLPAVGMGPLELLLYRDDDNVDNVVLRAVGNNVCYDITDELVWADVDEETGKVRLEIEVSRFTEIDGFGGREEIKRVKSRIRGRSK